MAGAGAGTKVAVYAVGRFQPPTIGHELLFNEVARLAEEKGGDAFVFVSSVYDKPGKVDRYPLTARQKIDALEEMYRSGIRFINTATDCPTPPGCGGPEKAYAFLRKEGYTDVTLVAGSDRAETFGPNASMWEEGKKHGVPPPKFVGLQRTSGKGATAMSGTEARRRARAGDYEGFAEAVRVGKISDDAIKELYDGIRARKGGRRTRRNRASGKALSRRGSRSRSGSSRTIRSSYGSRGCY